METKEEKENSQIVNESNVSKTYWFLIAFGFLINLIALFGFSNASFIYVLGSLVGSFVLSRLITYLYFKAVKKKSKRIQNTTQAIIFLIISAIVLIRILNYNTSSNTTDKIFTTPLPQADTSQKIETSIIAPITVPGTESLFLSFNFICPEDYESDQARKDDTVKLITEYSNNFSKATMADFLSYRYSLLAKNNCQKTLNYIKEQAKGEDPLTSYIKNAVNEVNQ